jgi:mevalonate pyrophosphate decarboxylase
MLPLLPLTTRSHVCRGAAGLAATGSGAAAAAAAAAGDKDVEDEEMMREVAALAGERGGVAVGCWCSVACGV